MLYHFPSQSKAALPSSCRVHLTTEWSQKSQLKALTEKQKNPLFIKIKALKCKDRTTSYYR